MIGSCFVAALLMMARVSQSEPPSPWRSTYPVLAQQICEVAETPEDIADMVALGWTESRLTPPPFNTWQLSPSWGPPTPRLALWLIHVSRAHCRSLSWYTTGGPYTCRPNAASRHREWLSRALLAP